MTDEHTDGAARVRVRPVRTRNGVRLEIAAHGGRAVRLCPLELESLTWQTHEALAALRAADDTAGPRVPAPVEGELPGGSPVELANEYAAVSVRCVRASGEDRLEIVAPRIGRGIRLAAHELETLAAQPPETFSRFLETPFGPEGEQ